MEGRRSVRVPESLRPIELRKFRITATRRMNLTLVLPSGTKKCPIVIFSHGNPVPPRFYYYLAHAWGKAGIATLFIHHLPDGENVRRASAWPVRARDISKVIGLLGKVHRRLDRGRVAVAGHSHGAHAAAVVAGAELVLPRGRKLILRDGRVCAAVLISSPPTGTMGLRASSRERMGIPCLEIAGAREGRRGRSRNEILVAGATHESFIDAIQVDDQKRVISRPDRKVQRLTRKLTLDFLAGVFQTPTPKKH